MRRKLFNANQLGCLAVAATLLLAARPARAQEAVQAQMWTATARYVYADDPNLKPLVANLNDALGHPQTLGEFEQRLATAATKAAAASKTPNIRVLQRQFTNMRTFNAAELVTRIPDSLLRMPVRGQGSRKEKLTELEKKLMALAQSTSTEAATSTPTAVAAAPVAAAPTPALAEPYQLAAQPAPSTSPLVWAALVMSGLSLAGVIRLLASRIARRSSSSSESSRGSHSHGHAGNRELTPEQHQEVTAMIARALASRTTDRGATPLPAPAPKLAPTPPAPTQSVKQKLVANSPRLMSTPTEPSLPALPSLASIAGAEPTPPAPTATAPAAEPAPALVAVEPGTSIELDVAPAAASAEPATRLQFVNEAPFNNTFAARTLSDTLAPYSIYEVIGHAQTPDQGHFRVVGNMVSHISNHRNILEPVCEYVAYPQGGETRIITEQPGEVRRRGADWEIMRRARIRFE